MADDCSVGLQNDVQSIIPTRRLNALECRGNYNATSNNMKLVHWPLMGGLLHLVQRRGNWAGPQSAQVPSRLPNVTPIIVLLYNGPFLCGFNVPIKGLNASIVLAMAYITTNTGFGIYHGWTVACCQHFDGGVQVLALMSSVSAINKRRRGTHQRILLITASTEYYALYRPIRFRNFIFIIFFTDFRVYIVHITLLRIN